MNMKEAKRLGENLEKSLSGDFKKCLKESWSYFKTLADNSDTPDDIRQYIKDHFYSLKIEDFEDKSPLYLIVDILYIYDMIKLYEKETGHKRI